MSRSRGERGVRDRAIRGRAARQNWICTACGILYVTHLVEFGYPERFVQDQAGHAYASTTAIYTGLGRVPQPAAAPRAWSNATANSGRPRHDQEDGLPWHLRRLMAEREMFQPPTSSRCSASGASPCRASRCFGWSPGHRSACRWTSSPRSATSSAARRSDLIEIVEVNEQVRKSAASSGTPAPRHGRPRSGDRDHAGSATARRAQLGGDRHRRTTDHGPGRAHGGRCGRRRAHVRCAERHDRTLGETPGGAASGAPTARTRSSSWRTLCTAAGSPGGLAGCAVCGRSSVTCAASTAPAASARLLLDSRRRPAPNAERSPASCPARTTDQSATPATAAIPNATNPAPSRQATTRGPPRRTQSPALRPLLPAAEATMLTAGRLLRRPRSLTPASLPTLLRSHCQAQAGMRTLRTSTVDQPARHRPHARPVLLSDPAHRTPAPDAASSPRERDTRTAYRSAHAATSAPFIAATSAASPDASQHGGRAARSVPVLPARARQAENLPRLRTITTLNAIDDYAQPVCAECAGSGTSYRCMRCGSPSDGYVRDRCAPCALRDRLDVLLSGDDGAIHPALRSVHAALSEWRNPRSVLTWLDRSDGASMLADLAQKNGGMAHDDLDRYPRSRVTNYLRQTSCTPARYRTATSTLNRSRRGSRLSSASSRPRTASSCSSSPAGRPAARATTISPPTNYRGHSLVGAPTDPNRRRPNELPRRSQSQPERSRSGTLNHGSHRTVDPPHRPGLHHLSGAAGLASPLTVPHRQAISPGTAPRRRRPLAAAAPRPRPRDAAAPARRRLLVLLYGHPVSRWLRCAPTSRRGRQRCLPGDRFAPRATSPALGVLVVELRDSAPPASIFGSSASTSDWLFPDSCPASTSPTTTWSNCSTAPASEPEPPATAR